MKKFKDFLLEKGISEEEFAKKTVEEMAQLQSEYSQEIISELKSQVEKAVTSEKLEEVKAVLKKIGYPEDGEANSLGSKAKSYVSCAIGKMSS